MESTPEPMEPVTEPVESQPVKKIPRCKTKEYYKERNQIQNNNRYVRLNYFGKILTKEVVKETVTNHPDNYFDVLKSMSAELRYKKALEKLIK